MLNHKIKSKLTEIALLVVLLLCATFTQVEAHISGASEPQEFELKPITFIDGEQEIEITIEDAEGYYGDLCPGVASAFRQTQIGIRQLWKNEIPGRDGIKIIAHFKGGEAPLNETAGFKGRYDTFIYILNNTKNLEIMDCRGGIDCFEAMVVKKSSNEKFNITLKEDVIPDGFFELKKKIKVTKTASDDEKMEFKTKWEKFRDNLLTKANRELFEYEIKKKEPEPFSAANAIIGGTIAILLALISWLIVKNFNES